MLRHHCTLTSRLYFSMPATQNLDRLSEILSGILEAIGEAGSHLFHALWPHVVRAWNGVKNFGESRVDLGQVDLDYEYFYAKKLVAAHPDIIFFLIILVLGVLLAQPLAKDIARILGFGKAGVTVGMYHVNARAVRASNWVYHSQDRLPPGSSQSYMVGSCPMDLSFHPSNHSARDDSRYIQCKVRCASFV